MTESEYSFIRDLSSLEHAEIALRNIVPENSNIIDDEEFSALLAQLSIWRRQHYDKLED